MHKNHFVAQKLWLVLFKKNIPKYTTPTFLEMGGVTQPLPFCRWHKNFSWYRVYHHKIDRLLLSRYFYFLFVTVFNKNEPERQLIAKLTLPHCNFIELSSSCSGFQNFFGFNTKSIKCA